MEKMLKAGSLLLVLCLSLSVFFGCEKKPNGSASEEPTASTEKQDDLLTDPAGTHSVTDHAGNVVTVPNTVNRIVVCDIYPLPSIISVFFGSAGKIVGMAPPSKAAAKAGLLSELYPEILSAETGFIDGTNVNIEELLKLRPDVVFYNAGNKALGEQLRNAGLCGIAFSAGKWQYDALETLDQWVATLEDVFQTESGILEKVRSYGEKTETFVTERVKNLTEKEKVFFLFQYTAENMATAGFPSFGSYWTEKIGAELCVTEKTEANSLNVGMEEVYNMNPSVIFVTNFTTATPEDLTGNKIGNYDWSEVPAVKNGRVYKMPLGMYRTYTSGADSPIALLWLASTCYPEAFSDVDIVKETVDYYQDVFGVSLTDEQAARIFAPAESGNVK